MIIITNLIALLLGLGLYYLTGGKIEILAAVIATGISLSLGIKQYKTENDRLFKELFHEFNAKYDEKFNEALQKIVIADESLSAEQKHLVVDYINFCAEEYLWRIKSRIPNEVWSSWENGMVYYFNNQHINDVLVKEIGQADSYYGLFGRLKSRVKNLE